MTPKKVMVYYRTNSRKIVWFGIFLFFCPKYDLYGIFPTHFLSKITNFVSEVENIGKYKFSKFTIPSYMLISKVIFNIHSFLYFLILIENWYILTKTEWEKCPTSAILEKLTKIFQIRWVCMSLGNNEPWPFIVSKAT